jgi:hypothetical protein
MNREHWRRAMRRLLLVVPVAVLLGYRPAAAANLNLRGDVPDLEVHGFVSQGFLLTSANEYLARSSSGSFHFSEAGLNFTLPATDRLRLGLQLFARDLGTGSDYRAVFDWYYLDYLWRDWLGVRAGRVKLPFGLYNDTSDTDSARTAILLPQSVYPARNRDFLLAQTGFEIYGYARLGAAGGLDYRLYGGTIFLDPRPRPGSPITILDLDVPFVVGARVLWGPPIDGLRLGGSLQVLRLDSDLLVPGSPGPLTLKVPATLWVASVEYAVRDLLLAAEYSRWLVRSESSDPSVMPEASTVSERAYVMAGYRVSPWFQAGAYYALQFPDVDHRKAREAVQHDLALTLRFDVEPYWLIKVEGHYMHGTAGLTSTLNGARPLSALVPDWALLVLKTTAYF